MSNATSVTILGQTYPVISHIKRNWYLVAHRNGPAIGRVSDCGNDVLASLDNLDDDEVPLSIHAAAIKAYREWSWPMVRDEVGIDVVRVLSNLISGVAKMQDAPVSAETHFYEAIAELADATNWRPGDPDLQEIIQVAVEHMRLLNGGV